MSELLDPRLEFAGLPPEQIDALLANIAEHGDAPFAPLPGPQSAAYESEADELLYGGAAGGSKSYLVLGLAATRHTRSLILRRQSVELDGLIADLVAMMGADRFNKVEREWSDERRSIKLGGCNGADDWHAYAGRARDFLAFDEASEFLEHQVSSLFAWNRSTDPDQRCRIVLASNPPRTAEGAWLVRWFAPWLEPGFEPKAAPGELRWFIQVGEETRWVDGAGTHEVDGKTYTARSRTYIPARLADNPYLNRSAYRASLENLREPLRSQLLEGDFTAGRQDDAWQLIPTDWIMAAQARWKPGPPAPMTAMGVDVAQGGNDQTALAARHGSWYAPVRTLPGVDTKDGPAVAAQVFAYMRDGCEINVDLGGGWGGSALDHMKHQMRGVFGTVPAEASNLRSRDGIHGFYNKRAELHWRFFEALDPVQGAGIALPPDPELVADLASPRWKLVSRGIQVELKEDIRKRLGRSPDKGDAVILAWAVGKDRRGYPVTEVLQTRANLGYESAKRRYGNLRGRAA